MSQETSPRAITAFVFAILGVVGVLPCVGPLVAILVGAGEEDGLARAGVIIGWATFAIYAVMALLLAIFVLGAAIASA